MSAINDLIKTVAQLRAPDGCPWDIEQTHQSIRDCLIEECAELLETIDRLDMPHMREELGDMLLQVVFHAQIAKENKHFDFEDVAEEINEKLIRRHPHVFEDAEVNDSGEVINKWEQIKAQEKKNGVQRQGVFKHIPPQLNSLLYAREIYKQITKKELIVKNDEINKREIGEKATGLTELQAGKALFEWVAACKENDIDPESALRAYTTNLRDSVEKQN